MLPVAGTPTCGLHMWIGLPPVMAAAVFLRDSSGLQRQMPKWDQAGALLPIMSEPGCQVPLPP